ncbi:MAG TPA: hypothetical protein VHX52_06605 [Steroidobacteraceae bacterium]|nr:hypothetical protein [Steroidobacteraceae bacterium]
MTRSAPAVPGSRAAHARSGKALPPAHVIGKCRPPARAGVALLPLHRPRRGRARAP